MRPAHQQPGNLPGWYITGTLILLAIIATLALTGCNLPPSRADQCRADGNTVTTEVEYDKKTKKPYTEYECVTPEGVEVDEWR